MTLRLEFLGAAGTVTGSRTLLRFEQKLYLVDCGLFQGSKDLRRKNWEALEVEAESLDAVLLTHAHIDHSGYLPRLYKQGFRGPIYCSEGTAALCRIMLLDAARLQEEDADYANRTHYSHHNPALPLYTVRDAEETLKLLHPLARENWNALTPNFSFNLFRSGHIVGSSFIQLSASTPGGQKFLTFSGDVGHHRSRTLKGPVPLLESDVLVLESTYGNRQHPSDDALEALQKVLNPAIERRGVVLIPSFAVGRAQEILYCIRLLEDQRRIPAVPVVLDSPMAQSATDIFLAQREDNLIDTSFAGDVNNFFPKLFESSETSDDSMLACMRDGPLIVISASGMLSGGRILHHLKHRVSQKENLVLFVGYQAEGSKGRFLQNLRQEGGDFYVHHTHVPVEADIVSLDHFSAHADVSEIMDWFAKFQRPPKKLFINHGTEESSQALADELHRRFGVQSTAVRMGDKFLLPEFSP